MGERPDRVDPYRLPPGVERRQALLDLGMPVSLSDFTGAERVELERELATLRASLRQRAS